MEFAANGIRSEWNSQLHKQSPPARTKYLTTRDGGFCLCRCGFNRPIDHEWNSQRMEFAANGIRSYTNKVRLRGLNILQPATAGFVCVDAVLTAQLTVVQVIRTTNNLDTTRVDITHLICLFSLPTPDSPLPTVAIAPQLPYTSRNGFLPVGFYPDGAISR